MQVLYQIIILEGLNRRLLLGMTADEKMNTMHMKKLFTPFSIPLLCSIYRKGILQKCTKADDDVD